MIDPEGFSAEVGAIAYIKRLQAFLTNYVGYLDCSECGNQIIAGECCPECHEISSQFAEIIN